MLYKNKFYSNVTFLSPNKKVTKEVGIGEALRKSALPYVPHPPPRQLCFRKSVLRDLEFSKIYPSDKKSEHFLFEQD